MSDNPNDSQSSEHAECPGADYDVLGIELAIAAEENWRGDAWLVRPGPLPLDFRFAAVCEAYRQSDEQKRESMRSGISIDGLPTLLRFSRRAAAFAMLEQRPRWLEDGLTAVAMIDSERIDVRFDTKEVNSRYVFYALASLHHAAERIHVSPRAAFQAAAANAGQGVARLIISFQNRSRKDKEIQLPDGGRWVVEMMVESDCGVGFVFRGSADYNPTLDLARITIECADRVAADKYELIFPKIATELPRAWVELEDRAVVDRALGEVRAVASISGGLRRTEHPLSESQHFVVWLLEMASESAAEGFVEIVAEKKRTPLRFSMVGLAVGRLACLICARCVNANATPADKYETNESLTRFFEPMASVLRRYASADGAQPKQTTDVALAGKSVD